MMIYFRNFVFLLVAVWETNVFAMEELERRSPSSSSSTPAATDEVGEFSARLKGYVGRNFDHETLTDLIGSAAPDYTTCLENIVRRYNRVSFIASGRVAQVWEAVLNNDNSSQGLKAGDSIAVKMVATSEKLPINDWDKDLRAGLEALIRCSYLRNIDGRIITEYFPVFYGVFYGPAMPESEINESKKTTKPDLVGYVYHEMEIVDRTFADKPEGWKYPNNVIFEFIYGEWAAKFFARLSIGDRKWRNYGLKEVSHGRCYHFGDDHYYFPPGETPKRLDLEDITDFSKKPQTRFSREILRSNNAETSEGIAFLEALPYAANNNTDVFTLFSIHFHRYKIDPQQFQYTEPVRHYYLDSKHIDIERSLPTR